MDKTTERIEWIDIAKALGILFVVLGHVTIPKNVDILIHSFHMPLFFLLSGLCFNCKKHSMFKEFFVSRFKTLIIPYLVFSVLLYYLWLLVLSLFTNEPLLGCNNLMNCIINPASTTSCYGAVNWFLPSLFIVEIISFLIIKALKEHKKTLFIVLIVISIIGIIYSKYVGYHLPLAIDQSIMAVSFYGFGWLLRDVNYNKIEKGIKDKLLITFIITIFLYVTFYKLSILNGMTNMRTSVYGDYFFYIFIALGISLLFIVTSIIISIVSKKVKVFNSIKYVGKHTMVILLFNSMFANLYLLICKGVSIENNKLLTLNNFIVSIIIVVICTFISVLINRYIPFLLGKTKKGK